MSNRMLAALSVLALVFATAAPVHAQRVTLEPPSPAVRHIRGGRALVGLSMAPLAAGSILLGIGICRSVSYGFGGDGSARADGWCAADPLFLSLGGVLAAGGLAMLSVGSALIHRGRRERREAAANASPTTTLPCVDLAFSLTPEASYARLELRF